VPSGPDARRGRRGRRDPLPPTLFRITTSTKVLFALVMLAFAATAVWAIIHGQPTVAVGALSPIFLAIVGAIVAHALRDGAFSRAEDDEDDPR